MIDIQFGQPPLHKMPILLKRGKAMFEDLVIKTRSIRNYSPDEKIEEGTLKKIVGITRYCPSSANLQPLKFRLVFEREECRKVFENIRYAGYYKTGTVPKKGHESKAYIIICNDKKIAPNTQNFLRDTGIVAQTMMLYACEQGIGGCMIGSFNEQAIKEELKIGTDFDIMLIISLGISDEV
ncbi:MAG: nitroreductase family protein, partial [Clostridia bacterium]|nr:nitroreductase family protein [Clostridia bacterium]